MKDKKLKCWYKIQRILNSYGYSYMDMLEYLHLIDISRMKGEFDFYIKQITTKKKKIKKKNVGKWWENES